MLFINICPYLEASFEILGRRWNGLILHYLVNCPNYSAHFSEIKGDLSDITPRALSLKLTELAEHELIRKNVTDGTPVVITYHLTEKGQQLANALKPLQAWAIDNITLEK